MKQKENDQKKTKKILLSVLIGLLILALIFGLAYYLMQDNKKEDENTLSYTELIKEISYGNIEKIEMTVGSTTVKVIKKAKQKKTKKQQ